MSTPEVRELTYAQALYEATSQEMERDASVFVLGQGVDDARGLHGTTKDLHKKFGAHRNLDTPIAEDAMTGIAIGAAMAGMRPIHVHQRMDFILLCMNQLINSAAKSHYMFAGSVKIPLVVRVSIGRSWGQGAQHSQALHSLFAHIPGLIVAMPTTPYDAKGCLISAIRNDNPVIFVEHRMLYNFKGHVPAESYEVPFGKARILREGNDVTIVGTSHMVAECLRAANYLQQKGINAEVIDPVTLTPIDIETIKHSVEKTGKILIVDNGWLTCGISAEIVSQLIEHGMTLSNKNSKRLGFAPTPCPTTRPLEQLFYPSSQTIAAEAYQLVTGKTDWKPVGEVAKELLEFKGPF